MNSDCSSAAVVASPIATTDAVGCPAATSRARFGPVSTPMRDGSWDGSTSATTSVIRSSVPCSTPFERLSTGTSSPITAAAAVSTVRNPCDGTPMTTTSAPVQAARRSDVAASDSGSVIPGR